MINHNVRLLPQRHEVSCWESAAIMALKLDPICLSTGNAKADPWIGLHATEANIQAFADYHNMVYHPSFTTWSFEGINSLLRLSPIWVGGLVPTGHAFVIGGSMGEQIEIVDPWPVNVGNRYWMNYGKWINQYPLGTLYMLTAR